MSSQEFLKGKIFDEEMTKRLTGKVVTGYIRWEERIADNLVDLWNQVEEILTANDPEGYIISRRGILFWEQKRKSDIKKYGDDSLYTVLPGRPHRMYVRLINDLKRDGINTLKDLLEKGMDVVRVKQIGDMKSEALLLVIDHYKNR